ncbi:MAG TPA: hypothetical protein VFF31_07650 [Blastocatellia bacterium]|nr:hypothetical protein [Blastocatellia bacterium]
MASMSVVVVLSGSIHISTLRLTSVVTIARTVIGPVTPAVLNVTSAPVVEDSLLPALVVQAQVVLPGPTMVARNATLSPSVIVDAEAMMLHDTVGQGGLSNVE